MSALDPESSGTNRIQVLVRVRPPIGQEANEELAVACSPSQEHIQVLVPERVGDKPQLPSHASLKGTAKKYTLDACLDGSVSQESVAMVCNSSDLVDGALQGFAVTVFAFGQTGSGKTYSMIGPRLGTAAFDRQELLTESDGFLARAYASVFQSIQAHQSDMQVAVRASCCEVYHEQVSDLAAGSKQTPLAVRHDKHRGFFVEGLAEVPCATCADALSFVNKALNTRHIRSHRLNEYSSRGHCIMTLQFETTCLLGRGSSLGRRPSSVTAGPSMKKYGKLVLVDLAGSERLKSTGNDGEAALRETGAINRSLFTLGQVLAGLSMRKSSSFSSVPPVIPYRDSTLTKLLYEGLKGNGRVLMMACCSPSKAQAEETLNTLHFASMALRVKCNPLCILDPQDKLVLNLRGTITKLRSENKQLSTALQRSRSHSGDGSDTNRDMEFESEQNIWEARPNDAPQRHTLDNPLTTYPSLCNPQGLTHYPSLSSQNVQGIWGSPARSRASASLQGLEPQGSSEFMPGSLSSVAEGEGWAAQQMRAGRGVRSVDQSVPFGSSPERVRLLQEDYHTRGSERSSKNSSPKRGDLSPPRGDVSPKRDVSPKPSRAGTIRGPFVLSANPSAFSLSTLPSTMQAGVAPLPGVEAFPELAAMEADFQKSLARGPIKPSLSQDQSILQAPSSSLGFPKGILQRHALSLGSAHTKGFGRNSPAAGVLDHLQMPNRLGLKFPSRDFGRVSKTLSAVPLVPKPDLPKSKAASPRATSPVAAPPTKPAAAEPAAVAAAAAAMEVVSQPETRRLPHSRFTEEYLQPIVPDSRAEPSRTGLSIESIKIPDAESPSRHSADLAEAETQYSERELASEAEPVTVETQTSTFIGQIQSDPSLPLHGFRRHMSLREPDILLQPVGPPAADDIVTTTQPYVTKLAQQGEDESSAVNATPAAVVVASSDDGESQYEADFVSDLVKTLSAAAADDYDADQEEAAAEVAAMLQSEASGHYSMDADSAVESSLKRLTTDVEDQYSADATAVVDDTMASLGQDTEAGDIQDQSQAIDTTLECVTSAVATADTTDQSEAVDLTMTTLTTRVTNEHDSEQLAVVETLVTSLTDQTEVADSADQLAAVADVMGSLRAQSAEHYERSDSLAVSEALEGVQTGAADDVSSQARAAVDEAVEELADETFEADETEQVVAIGDVVDFMAADTVQQSNRDEATAVDSALAAMQAEAVTQLAREVTADVDDTLASLESEAASQYALEVSSAVEGTLTGLGEDAAEQFAAEVATAVDLTVAGLEMHAADQYSRDESAAIASILNDINLSAESANEEDADQAVRDALSALGTEAVTNDSHAADEAVADILTSLESQAAAEFSQHEDSDVLDALTGLTQSAADAADQEAALAVDGLVGDLGTDAAAHYRRQDSVLINATVDALTADADRHFAQDQAAALDSAMSALSATAAQHYDAQQDLAVTALVTSLGAEAADYDAADQEAVVGDLVDSLGSQAAMHQEAAAQAVAAETVSGLAVEAALVDDQQAAAAVAAVVTSLGAEVACAADDQDAAAIQEVVSDLGDSAAHLEAAEQARAVHDVIASLASGASEHFSTEQEAALQSTLQSLTKAAFDEDEADRDAAVQELVTALSDTTEVQTLETLRSEVDTLVAELRVEVVTSAVQEHDAKQAAQAMQEATRAHYSRQQSLVVDRLVDNLALEAAVSYGGTRKPAAAHALKAQLHKAAQILPSLAAASTEPTVCTPEVVVMTTQVVISTGDDNADNTRGLVAADAGADVVAQPLSTVPEEPSMECSVSQQLPEHLPEHVMPRLHSLDSINALMWPMSRRVSSAGSRASSHLHLYVDNGGEPSLHPRLRSTASINALVWPASRPDSSRSSSSQATAVEEATEVVSTRGQELSAANAKHQRSFSQDYYRQWFPWSAAPAGHDDTRAAVASNTSSGSGVLVKQGTQELVASAKHQQVFPGDYYRHWFTWSDAVPASSLSSQATAVEEAAEVVPLHSTAAAEHQKQEAELVEHGAGSGVATATSNSSSRPDALVEQRAQELSVTDANPQQVYSKDYYDGWFTWSNPKVTGSSSRPDALVSKPLPSAASIDELLWPGDIPIAQHAALHAEHAGFKSTATTAGQPSMQPPTLSSPAGVGVRSSATFRAQKRQSLLDRAAAKRALAALLAAGQASQIRGWSPRQRAPSPAPAVEEEPPAPVRAAAADLPSVEDIEALVPLEEARVEPVPAQPVAAEPVLAEATAAAAEAEVSPAVEIEAAAVDVSGPNKMERALAAQQERESFAILEEAIQAAALEADFTFPDDVSSSHEDQSLVIDDIIESLESDALEAEQEALEVQRAAEAAQAERQAEEDARAAEQAEQQAQAALKAQEEARLARQAEEEAQIILRAQEEARAAQQAKEEAEAALRAEQQARAALQAELEAQSALRAEEEARAACLAEEEAKAVQQAKAEAEAARQAEEEARAARQAEEEAQAALRAAEEARAAAIRAEEEAEAAAAQIVAEAEAAAIQAEEEEQAAAAAALRAEEEAKAAALKAEEEAKAAAIKAEEEERAAALKAEKEAQAAAEMEAWAAGLKAQEEARVAAVKAEEDARAARQAEEDAKAMATVLAQMDSVRSVSRQQEDFAALIDQQQAVLPRKARPPSGSKVLPPIREEEAVEVAQRSKTDKAKLAEDYPGLEPAYLPEEALFKFKGQALMRDDSSAGDIRAAPAATEVAVYSMAQEATFRETPLKAAVSITPRSRLGRTHSSLGPGEADQLLRGESPEQLTRSQSQAAFGFSDGRAYSSIDRTRSSFNYSDPATQSLMERSGSSIAQYDAMGNLVADAPEPQALQWAARNPWFGTDSEMTYYAYEVHDHLIEAEGLDPNSKEYYEQIGLRVAAQFPERYAERSVQPTPRLSDMSPVVSSSLRQMSVPKSGRISPFDASSTLTTQASRPPSAPTAVATEAVAVKAAVVKRSVLRASSSGSSYTSSSYSSGGGSGSSYTRSSSSGSYSTATGSGSSSQSRSVSGDGSGSGTASTSRTTSARASSRSASFSGTGSASGSRSTYSRTGTGSDSRNVSASSYSSARSGSSYTSYTTDSRPVTARLPDIVGAQSKGSAVVKSVAVVKSTVVKSGAMPARGAKQQQRPETASSSASESGSDSSYSSGSSGSSYSRSDSYASRSSSRPSELPKLPNLPATRQKAEAYQDSKAAAAGKPPAKKMVVAGSVTQSSRVASRAASDSGSSSSSYTSRSSYTSGSTSRTNTARSSKLPAIAASKGGSDVRAGQVAAKQSLSSGSQVQAGSVQQQQEVMRSNLQQTKAATSRQQARIKNAIQQQLQPGKMLF